MKRRPLSLYQRTGLTLAAGLLLFSVFALGVVRLYVIAPITERAAEELAALLELSAKVWVELPPWTRQDYARELRERHGLRITASAIELAPVAAHQEFFALLEAALARRFDVAQAVLQEPEQPDWYWVELPVGQETLRLGFAESRLRQRIPAAVLLVGAGGAVFVLITALLVVRRVTRPLSRLHDAVQRLGRGEPFQPVPETGAREFADLAHRINRTEQEVRELLANRTTLLAGISHDLRTPLARMRLALELLQGQAEPGLVAGLEADLDEMNELISRVMELARGLERQESSAANLGDILRDITDDYARSGAAVQCAALPPCTARVPPKVFRRVIGNLLDNAIRYGAGQPVELQAQCLTDRVVVRVRDRGPGIPPQEREAVLRPFYRLEGSRSRGTGGSGLGLAVVRQLCAAHGWTLILDDVPGGGFEVRVEIPHTAG